MNDGWYNALGIGLNLASTIGTIAGQTYMVSPAGQRAYAYRNIDNYNYTKTVIGHNRPYTYDVAQQRMIIKHGIMSVDSKIGSNSLFFGGRNYNFAYGNWELSISNSHRTIYHFLYRGSIRGMY